MKKKTVALLLAIVLALGCGIGGTLAWLLDKTETVTNTFTESNIQITLVETDPENDENAANNQYQMIPGHIITKDPVVTVENGSEDCWLFVKIAETQTPDLDAYIAYALTTGWENIDDGDSNEDTIVIGRKVMKTDLTRSFGVLAADDYTFTNDTETTDDDVTVSWANNQVGVKPEVTDAMMAAIANVKPTLTFEAYAVQLYKTNGVEFTAAEAWAQALTLNN